MCKWCAHWYSEGTYRRRAGRVERDPAGPAEGEYKVLRDGYRVARGSHLPAP